MDPQNEREALFERAKVGEITGDEADAEAIRLGLGSLSHKPGPEDFRPETDLHWTLPMAVAWIAYLDLDEVREWSAPYCAGSFHWIWQRWRRGFDGPIYEGWHLEQRLSPTLAGLALGAAYDRVNEGKTIVMPVSEAREALWIALREGFFAASGIDTETERRVEIPHIEWHDLVAVEGKGRIDGVRRGSMGSGYRDVLIPSVAVRGFWIERRKTPPQELPPLMPPVGDGYMPLSCAAQWIATKGGTIAFDPRDESHWRDAFAELMAAMASEKVPVVGTRGGIREPVPGFNFAGCQVDYPFSDPPLEMMMSHVPYVRSYPYVDDEHWRNGFDDALISRHRDHWTMLMVERNAVRERWPFDLAAGPVPVGAGDGGQSTADIERDARSWSPLPRVVSPEGSGFMPLYCAVLWIATKCGTDDFDANDIERWRIAYSDLLAAIASSKVRVVGARGDEMEPVPSHLFADLPVVYPHKRGGDPRLERSGRVHLRSYAYTGDEEAWRRGWDDALVGSLGPRWSRLVVAREDVRALWPESSTTVTRSGAPGRPTSMHLVIAELERRAAAGEMLDSIVEESRTLSKWLASNHREKPQAKPKAIEVGIRERYWDLRGKK